MFDTWFFARRPERRSDSVENRKENEESLAFWGSVKLFTINVLTEYYE
jgi:hypothetical protein